uniref:Uncharacterized protein n=1 Tax=Bartonella rochalimae ATCC BAA-1498 TaxID=685782 RepID=E6YK97_9HYPH|nr:hypothetical protein BARRO_10218 [Bartonella rochalimae ATCC BAA-1498]
MLLGKVVVGSDDGLTLSLRKIIQICIILLLCNDYGLCYCCCEY